MENMHKHVQALGDEIRERKKRKTNQPLDMLQNTENPYSNMAGIKEWIKLAYIYK